MLVFAGRMIGSPGPAALRRRPAPRHPLWRIRQLADDGSTPLSDDFDTMCVEVVRRSGSRERLLKASYTTSADLAFSEGPSHAP